MLPLITAALIMGILGSFHCIGMCGPLALSLPLNSNSDFSKFTGALIYNLGRVVTYSLFGVLFGAIGNSFAFFGFQQWLSIIIGVVILLFVFLPQQLSAINSTPFFNRLLGKLRNRIALLFHQKTTSSLFFIGILNGLLPCGLVYMAAAAAVATGNLGRSIAFMAFFGLGTLPAMWATAFFGNYASLSLRKSIRRLYPYMMTLMACLLILRGLGLGIPHLSPQLSTGIHMTKISCHMP